MGCGSRSFFLTTTTLVGTLLLVTSLLVDDAAGTPPRLETLWKIVENLVVRKKYELLPKGSDPEAQSWPLHWKHRTPHFQPFLVCSEDTRIFPYSLWGSIVEVGTFFLSEEKMGDERRSAGRGRDDRGNHAPVAYNQSQQPRPNVGQQPPPRHNIGRATIVQPSTSSQRSAPVAYDPRQQPQRSSHNIGLQPPPRHGIGRSTIMDRSAPNQQLAPMQISERALSSPTPGPSNVRTQHQRLIDGSISGSSISSSSSGTASALVPIRNRPINSELLVTRPRNCVTKQGTDGRPIRLQANYFKIIASNDWRFYKYHVDFTPAVERTVVRKGLLRLHQATLGTYIFDGTIMYMSHRLKQELTTVYSALKSDNTRVEITIRFVGDMEKGDEHYLQFYNIIMRKSLEYLHLQLVGRNFYDARNKVEVPEHKLELWPGYLTSIRQHERNILMCAEIGYKVMRQQTVLDILHDCLNEYGVQDYQTKFKGQVIGITVLTDYNNFMYRIEDVDFTASPSSTFVSKNREITYRDYYLNKYQINIRDTTQPMLVSRNKARDRRAGLSDLVYLVPELTRTTGLSDNMRGNYTVMKALAAHTRLNPRARIERLLNFNRRLQGEPNVVQEFNNWDLRLDKRLVDVPARQFPPENIHFNRVVNGKNIPFSVGEQAEWSKLVWNTPMYLPAKLQDWFVIVPKYLEEATWDLINTMRKSVVKMRFEIANPKFAVLPDDHTHLYPGKIEEIMKRNNPQLIMCVVRNNQADRYAAIKKKCCVDRPVPSQCVLAKNLTKNQSVATKIAIQMNCKIGGIPWVVAAKTYTLMVVGFDVCRDSNNRGRSYGAMVASLDYTYGKYFSAINPHTSDEELSNNLVRNMVKALGKYKFVNRQLPERIVVYRDGVGDGQMHFVFKHELEIMKKALADIYGCEERVKLAYIIVTKRLNTRLFMNGNNPPPGTIVDDVITIPIKFDFYIVSQSVRQGSVAPTGYNVIYNTCCSDPTRIQQLSYKLTHMYFNWSSTVRVPAPCQLAHKLAFLVSQSLHESPSDHLENILHYL